MTDTPDIAIGGRLPVLALTADTVVKVGPDATLYDVADALSADEVGDVLVTEGGTVVGIVSERDLARAMSNRLDPATTRAIDVAHRRLVWCDVSATVAEVAREMMRHYVRHVLVEEDGRMVGIVSARDLLGAYAAAELDLDDEEEPEEGPEPG